MATSEKVYTEDEVRQRLTGPLRHWYVEDGWLQRKFQTEDWRATLMVVNAIGHLAEAAWHHPDLTVSYSFVIVKLITHSAKGISDKDLGLAERIEEFISWRPGAPSKDGQVRYVKYDD